jgi:hypothetical protein
MILKNVFVRRLNGLQKIKQNTFAGISCRGQLGVAGISPCERKHPANALGDDLNMYRYLKICVNLRNLRIELRFLG